MKIKVGDRIEVIAGYLKGRKGHVALILNSVFMVKEEGSSFSVFIVFKEDVKHEV